MESMINEQRLEEIATMTLHKLVEMDKESAWDFIMGEIEMDAKELEYFGLHRKRKAVNIQWDDDDDELPNEMDIPDEVDTDDIIFYLEEQNSGSTVNDYELEEEDE